MEYINSNVRIIIDIEHREPDVHIYLMGLRCFIVLLSIIQYVGLYVFNLPISVVMIERIYIYFVLLSSYYHHQIGSMNYYPLLRVRS